MAVCRDNVILAYGWLPASPYHASVLHAPYWVRALTAAACQALRLVQGHGDQDDMVDA